LKTRRCWGGRIFYNISVNGLSILAAGWGTDAGLSADGGTPSRLSYTDFRKFADISKTCVAEPE
jgi:hypothetical protein